MRIVDYAKGDFVSPLQMFFFADTPHFPKALHLSTLRLQNKPPLRLRTHEITTSMVGSLFWSMRLRTPLGGRDCIVTGRIRRQEISLNAERGKEARDDQASK